MKMFYYYQLIWNETNIEVKIRHELIIKFKRNNNNYFKRIKISFNYYYNTFFYTYYKNY